jgi:hypothetical protein
LAYVGTEVWIAKDRHTLHARCDLLEQLQPFPAQTVFHRHKAGDVAAGPGQTFDEASAHWIGDSANTIGTAWVAWMSGPRLMLPLAMITSGASVCVRSSSMRPRREGAV